MAEQIQQVVSDIPQWMRDLMFGSKPANMSDAEWAQVQQSGFQGLIPGAFSAAQRMGPSAAQRAALGEGIPEQRVAGLDPLTLQAQALAARSAGVPPPGSTPEQQQEFYQNRNLATQVMRGEVDFNTLSPAQQQAVSSMDLGYSPYLQSAQGAFGAAAQGFGAGQNLLQQGIGSALQFGGDPAAREALEQQLAGADPETRARALQEFDSRTAYGRLTEAQGIEGLARTRGTDAVTGAQTDVNAYRNWLNTQTVGAPSTEALRTAAKDFNNTLTDSTNAALTAAGVRVTDITNALSRGTTDFGTLSKRLTDQGVDLKALPEKVLANLRDAAKAFDNRITEIDTGALDQSGTTQRAVDAALTAAGTNADAAITALNLQGTDLNKMPADMRNRLTDAAAAGKTRFGEIDQGALDQAGTTQRAVNDALVATGGNVDAAITTLNLQGIDLNKMPADTRNRLIDAAQASHSRLEQLDQNALDQAGMTQRQLQGAVERARDIAGSAANKLLGAGAQFDPTSTTAFMDPYRREVVEAQQREMQRLTDIQRQDIRAQAVQSGAFGGSREGVQQAELTRNLIDQQSRLSAELMSQGYSQAQANAMAAFEQAQQRQLQGAGQAGQIGLSAEELASRTQTAGGQMGLQALQQAMQNAQYMSQQGLSAEEIAARTGLSIEELRQANAMGVANLAQSMGGLRTQSQLAAGQMGLSAYEQALRNAQFQVQQGLTAEQAAAQSGLSAEEIRQAVQRNVADISQNITGLKTQSQLAAGQMGLSAYEQAARNALAQGQQRLGAEQTGVQATLDAQRMQQAASLGEMGASQQLAATAVQGAGVGGGLQQQAYQAGVQAQLDMAQRRLSAEQIAAQTRLSEAQIGQQGRIAGMQGSLDLGNLGMQQAGQVMQGADLMRTLGATQAQMAGQESDIFRQAGMGTFAGAEALGGLGSRQLQQAELANALQGSDINRLLSFGTLQQGQQQLGMDVNFQNQMRQWAQPMQTTQWLGDFVRGFPGGQSTTQMTSQQQPGWGQQLMGAGFGIAGLMMPSGRSGSNFGF